MPSSDTQFNSENAKENQKKGARSKIVKNTQYYATRLKETFIKSRNLEQSMKFAQRREKQLLEISVGKIGLTELQIKELNVIQKYTAKFLDKTMATKFESDNKHEVDGPVAFFTILPDNDGKR